ncbi:ATP-binding protein [Leifsonia sp. F6_8S_P_1B]|uniref:ATP-binding protein n=1 Tax=Leifsonia williamsii TaxID=3035919 RepID=A0ABT8KC99_9MICO|nr:ATP-binding protein [Leifsonia williamsii]MDN4615083.1 ATP-binding protein [Leifsonia williamsii]
MRSDTDQQGADLRGVEAAEALFAGVRDAARRAGSRPVVVLIDGPSGAGKSSLADELVAAWPAAGTPRLVRMDELYPGWDGLDAGSAALGGDLLAPLRQGGTGHYRRWDWVRDRPAEPVAVDAEEPVVVEGCGTLAAANLPYADLTVWLDADDALRKRRALERDGEVFAREWDRWQAQFERYVEREHPREAAMLRLDVTSRPLGGLLAGRG